MIIRINKTEKLIILDSGSTEETFWYDELKYCEDEIDVFRQGKCFMVIPNNYGIRIYEDAE